MYIQTRMPALDTRYELHTEIQEIPWATSTAGWSIPPAIQSCVQDKKEQKSRGEREEKNDFVMAPSALFEETRQFLFHHTKTPKTRLYFLI